MQKIKNVRKEHKREKKKYIKTKLIGRYRNEENEKAFGNVFSWCYEF